MQGPTLSRVADDGRALKRLLAMPLALVAALVLPGAVQPAFATGDRQIAEAGVFQSAEFPAGWRVTTSKRSTDQRKCSDLKKNSTVLANSVQFAQSEGTSIVEAYSSAVAVYKNEARASDALKRVSSSNVKRCLRNSNKQIFRENVPNAGEKVDAQLSLVIGPGYGDTSKHIELKSTGSAGFSGQLYANVVFVRAGRAVGIYLRAARSELGPPSTFAPGVVDFNRLVTNAVDRLRIEQGDPSSFPAMSR